MCIISVILINLVVVEYYRINYEKEEIKKVVKYDIENIGYIRFDYNELKNLGKKNASKVFEEIEGVEGVKLCGSFENGIMLIEELYNDKEYLNIRKKIVEDMVDETHSEFEEIERRMFSQTLYKYSNILNIDSDIIKLCNIELSEGEIAKNDKYIPLLIGHNYRNIIDVGQLLTRKTDGKKYLVTGVLKKNSRWLINGDISNSSNVSINLDNEFVVFDDDLMNYDSSYIIFDERTDKLTRERTLDKIRNISNKCNLGFNVLTIDEIINSMKSDMFIVSRSWIVLAIFAFVIGMLCMSSIAIVTVLSRKNDIGILYAVGFSEKNIGGIVVVENMLQIGFGCIIGYCIALLLSISGNTYVNIKKIIDIQFRQGIISVGGIYLLCTLIASIVPIIIINKSKPFELIME
jgi:putative ABC transport system permease protein